MSSIADSWRITLGQFIAFLEAKGRQLKCPVCPHEGNWNFIVEDGTGPGRESRMTLNYTRHEHSSEKGNTVTGAYMMECPNCGFVLKTSAAVVCDYLTKDGGSNG